MVVNFIFFSKASYSALYKHKKAKHEGVTYPCDRCNYVAGQKAHLKNHIENIHEKVRYPCAQCDYSASKESNLIRHTQIKHEGVERIKIDPATLDDLSDESYSPHAKRPRKRRRSNVNKVEGEDSFKCDYCGYKGSRAAVYKHTKAKHEG